MSDDIYTQAARDNIAALGPRDALVNAIDQLVRERIAKYDCLRHGGTNDYDPGEGVIYAMRTIKLVLNDIPVRAPLLKWKHRPQESRGLYVAETDDLSGRFELQLVETHLLRAYDVYRRLPGGSLVGIKMTCPDLAEAKAAAQQYYDNHHVGLPGREPE